MKTFEVEGWYRYANGDEKDFITISVDAITPEQAIELFKSLFTRFWFYSISLKEIFDENKSK